ncbi:hypothetical protein E4H04_10535 [Candidatus Bathyarchaeota archaeon]|nr:MAG: hypothetical protein E4H04_10535 [Candidatus Bathyarchaeota archaeon]
MNLTQSTVKQIINITRAAWGLIQFSVFRTSDQRAAKAVRDLVEYYDCQVFLFKDELVDEL